ncbi:MAG: hypothetical protein R2764_06460 [Bacteroidales bacterium]
MSSKKKKSKGRKTLLIILSIALLLLLILFTGVNAYLENLIKNKIDSQLNKNPKSLYHIMYEDLDLNIMSGSVTIKNISIQPSDSASWMLNNGLLGSLFKSSIEEFIIKHLKIFDFVSDRNIDISKIILNNATTKYIVNPNAKKTDKKDKNTNQNIFPEILNKLKVDDFEFQNTTFQMAHYNNTDEYLFELDSLSINISDIYIDSTTASKTIPLNFSSIEINTQMFELKSMKYYSISTSGIDFNLNDTTFTLNAFKLTPKYPRDEFNTMIKYNDDLFSVSTEKIVLNGLNINKIEQSKLLNFNSVNVYNPVIGIYRDKRLPDASFKKKKLITSIVKSIPIAIEVDTLKILNGQLTYEEMHNTTDKPGKVFFNPLFLTAYNVTNDSILIAQNAHLQIDVKGKIMGKSEITANFDFYLNRSDDYFTAKGNLKAIRGAEFNQILEALLLAEIQSCNVHSASFDFTANDDVSHGKLDLVYDSLVAVVLKHKDPKKESKTWSWLANNFIAENNLPDDPNYRTGIIHFERNKDKALVNYLWNSIKTGIITSILPMAEKKELKKEAKQEKAASKKKNEMPRS